ncbi:MAG: Asp-tRNA(Asn)/Glu-tRNA(Gln) amidotransferase subunit GatB [Clostridia bacterium]
MELETKIGLEIHVELSTETKAFCSCKSAFGGEANTRCCPVCMGLPGALPVLNKELVKNAIKMGIATNCTINNVIKNARKNYFYPDLPKGYQISQNDLPVCVNGFVMVSGRKIRINRIHIEEDAGKLLHFGEITKIDYNRAGVPLIEIVTEPDIKNSDEAKELLKKIKNLLLYLGISDCKMQEGSLRCDVNVSVREKGQREYNERCEMKNINSFSEVIRCIEYEEARQRRIMLSGGKVCAETRRWDGENNISVVLRDKETTKDYRYFPEPDIPYIYIGQDFIDEIRKNMPELPDEKVKTYVKEFGLSKTDSENIVKIKNFTVLLEEAVELGTSAKVVANWLLGEISKLLNKSGMDAEKIPFSGKDLADLQSLIDTGRITQTMAKDIVEVMFNTGRTIENIVKGNNFIVIEDENEIRKLAEDVITSNKKSVTDYKNGKKNAFGYLIGQCMKKSGNRADVGMIKKLLEELL